MTYLECLFKLCIPEKDIYYFLKQHFVDLKIFEEFNLILYFLKQHYDLKIFGIFAQVLHFLNMVYYQLKYYFDDLMIFVKFMMIQDYLNMIYYYLKVINYSDYLFETFVQAQHPLEMIYYFQKFLYFLDDLIIFENYAQAFAVQHKIYYYIYCFDDLNLFEKFVLAFLFLKLINFEKQNAHLFIYLFRMLFLIFWIFLCDNYIIIIFGNFVMLVIMTGNLGIYGQAIAVILNQRINDNYNLNRIIRILLQVFAVDYLLLALELLQIQVVMWCKGLRTNR